MKQILLFWFTFVFVFTSQAQENERMKLYVVGEAKKLDELVARPDHNNEYCAGLKVISDFKDLSYVPNEGAVGDIDRLAPGTDFIFLVHRERVVEVHKLGYEPLKIILSEYGIFLKPKEVWEIRISGDKKVESLPVTFQVKPAEAKISISGKSIENEKPIELEVGKHSLRIEKSGYQSIAREIIVNKENVLFKFDMQEVEDALLEIETTPPGATVFLDEVKLGEAPLSKFYPPGIYQLKVEKEGYISLTGEDITVSLPNTRKIYILEENVGFLTINTSEKAIIRVNGETKTQVQKMKFAPQVLIIEVAQTKAETIEKQIILKRNDDIVLDLYPQVKTATIQLAVTPFDAKIELTGDAGELYSSTGSKKISDIPFGKYTLKVSAADYLTYTESIDLKQGDKLNKSIKLEQTAAAAQTSSTQNARNDDGIEMVFVKGGTYTMGCTSEPSDCGSDEKPTHQVTVGDFYIGKYEVTQKQWREIMGSNPSSFKNCDNCPVEKVSWNDVQEFITKLNQKTGKKYRLPTEAEWEYAARGGTSTGLVTTTKFAGSNDLDEVAWYGNNSRSETHPVGKKKPNALGIYDMSGNVWEWCSDWYGADYYQSCPKSNPQGPSSGSRRVMRGGSWGNVPQNCRVAHRDSYYPAHGFGNFGFRLSRMD